MTPEEIQNELRECLRLQTELEAKRDELIGRFKRVLNEARRDGQRRIITEIDGEIYELGRADLTRQSMDSAHKHKGFFSEYRLICLGKPITK